MELYTIEEVAKMLSVHPRTVRRYIEKGQLSGERIGGIWRVSEEAVKAMFDAPELRDAISERIQQRSEDMLDLYLHGKHRLQQNGIPVLIAFVFDPTREAWVLAKSAKWMAELNRLGQSAQFDFTMTGSEQGLYRLTLIASPAVSQAMLGELERLRTPDGNPVYDPNVNIK